MSTRQIGLFKMLRAYDRLRGSPDSKKSYPLLSLVISLFSLLIASSTFYFNTFRQTDNLRVIIPQTPSVSLAASKDKLTVAGGDTQTITLINSGTREVAVTNIMFRLVLNNWSDEKDERCRGQDSTYMFQLETEAIVIPPTSVKLLKFEPATGELSIPLDAKTKRLYDTIATCVEFGVVTPDRFLYPKVLFLEALELSTITETSSGARVLHDNSRPLVLVQERISPLR